MIEQNGWWIPDTDVGTVDAQTFNPRDVKLALDQISRALKWIPAGSRSRVVQGGARCGLWPVLLAAQFEYVEAFEPDHENHACAKLNLEHLANVSLHHAALGPMNAMMRLVQTPESGGLHYLAPHDEPGIPTLTVTIDSAGYTDIAAIFLDVEGYELDALRGAAKTLEMLRPVVVAEENSLLARYGRERGDIDKFLAPYGYERVDEYYTLPEPLQHDGEFRGSDLIFAVRRDH